MLLFSLFRIPDIYLFSIYKKAINHYRSLSCEMRWLSFQIWSLIASKRGLKTDNGSNKMRQKWLRTIDAISVHNNNGFDTITQNYYWSDMIQQTEWLHHHIIFERCNTLCDTNGERRTIKSQIYAKCFYVQPLK